MNNHIIWFLIPKNIKALTSNSFAEKDLVPFYINPQSVEINENKLINEKFTKGGYSVSYWGEELSTLSARGTTGSGGIEAINILNQVYRFEQSLMSNILLERARIYSENENKFLNNDSNLSNGILETLDDAFDNSISNIIDGTKSIIEEIVESFTGVSETTNAATLIPSLGAFAVSLEIAYQGAIYRGFFKNFGYTENAETPGLFDYNFTFKITKKTGQRKNFMPWHRSPYDMNGKPIHASLPIEGSAVEELNFKTDANYSSQNNIVSDKLRSSFRTTQEGTADKNSFPINRRGSF